MESLALVQWSCFDCLSQVISQHNFKHEFMLRVGHGLLEPSYHSEILLNFTAYFNTEIESNQSVSNYASALIVATF